VPDSPTPPQRGISRCMKDLFTAGLVNNKTTLAGMGAGSAFYLSTVGARFPDSQEEWLQFAFAVLIYALSWLAKDAA